MAVYRGKYVLPGLGSIDGKMEHNLDIAYDICMSYRPDFPCEMCGRCCHQPHILVQPGEVDRISSAAGIPIFQFMSEYLVPVGDGNFRFRKTDPCAFLGEDNRCRIWKSRPEICDLFPYAVSMFMSRVYLALTNPEADIMDLISYMDDEWPCTRVIKDSIAGKIEDRRCDVVRCFIPLCRLHDDGRQEDPPRGHGGHGRPCLSRDTGFQPPPIRSHAQHGLVREPWDSGHLRPHSPRHQEQDGCHLPFAPGI